jgi:glycosyltransferase involved in cell wall biosynthesis
MVSRKPIPKRVLMTAGTTGGVWSYAMTLARRLSARGVRVDLATMGEPLRREQRAEVDRTLGLTLHESRFLLESQDDPWGSVEHAGRWLLDLEAKLTPCVVHLNAYCHAALPWRAPRLVVGHSCVLSWWKAVMREPLPDKYARYAAEVTAGLHAADAVVAPTHAMLHALEHHYGRLAHATVIPNGCEPPLSKPPSEKDRFVFCAGRLWDRAKNAATLAHVARKVPWPVFVAGSARGPRGDHEDLEGVRALGWLGPAEIDAWMARAAIYAMPARYEPFGLSALEAARRGCALVLGDIHSLREVWREAAVYVRPDDSAQLTFVLRTLMNDEGARTLLASRARARAAELTPERCAERYLALYGDLLAKRAQKTATPFEAGPAPSIRRPMIAWGKG